jgi:hypothetical protein
MGRTSKDCGQPSETKGRKKKGIKSRKVPKGNNENTGYCIFLS